MPSKNLEKTLKALANRRRLDMLAYLTRAPKATISQVAARLHMPFKTASRNLVILERAGVIIKDWQYGRIIYQLEETPEKFVEEVIRKL